MIQKQTLKINNESQTKTDYGLAYRLHNVGGSKVKESTRPLYRGSIVGVGTFIRSPQLPGYEYRQCLLDVWCPRCNTHHRHGWDSFMDGRFCEHRYSHSPDVEGGYWISPWRQIDPEYAGHVIRPGLVVARRVHNA